MIDAVLSYHMNPQTCGVAKWNVTLAKQLGVPHDYFGEIHRYAAPLVSLKFSEGGTQRWFPGSGVSIYQRYHLFAHDWCGHFDHECWLIHANTVIAANPIVANAIRPVRPSVVTAFCPSTITGDPHRGAYRVLVFGMAHKLSLPHFEELKARLDIEHPDYTVELSTAVHEGNPWDVALTDSVNAMRSIFGDKLRVLGYLGDDALAKELQDCDAVACYYQPALRANNTTAWAALEAGKTLYTNTDKYSPPLDAKAHSWDKLLEIIRA